MYKILKYRQNYQLEQVKLEDFLPAEAVLLRLPNQTSQRKHNFHFPLVDKAHNSKLVNARPVVRCPMERGCESAPADTGCNR